MKTLKHQIATLSSLEPFRDGFEREMRILDTSRTGPIFAVLLNFNDGEDVLRSVRKLSSFASIKKIVLVDNGSTDDSLQKIKENKNPKLIIVENKKNLGFGKGCNIGIKIALVLKAQAIANLNPDLDYSSDFIAELAKNDADLVTPVLKFKKAGKTVYDFGGKINWLLGRTYHLESYKPRNPYINISPDFVSGGAVLIKRKVFEKIGFFDESFFMYFEDADFSIRAKKAGFKLAIDSKVIIEHKLKIHKSSRNWQKLKYNLISNLKFINKWIQWYFKPQAYAYWLVLTVKSIVS